MTQKYGKDKVYSPGTVIISAGAEVSDIRKVVSPVLRTGVNSTIYYIDFSFDKLKLGGSAFAQSLDKIGKEVPTVQDSEYFANAFNAVQELINKELILAGHDISAGGMITTMLEMNFANTEGGLEVSLDEIPEKDLVKILFSENPGILIQVEKTDEVEKILKKAGVAFIRLARPCDERHLLIHKDGMVRVVLSARPRTKRRKSSQRPLPQLQGTTAAIPFPRFVHGNARPIRYLGRSSHTIRCESSHHS